MKKRDKIILFGLLSACLTIVGLVLFSHFLQHLTPAFGLTHAQDLHTDLSPGPSSQPWIFNIWKVSLSLANVIVVIMLLFVAIVNIFHLSYDTYAIKKSLPLLIVGIIMANFSLLICRMIVDAAQVLTNTFAGNMKEVINNYLCAVAFGSSGSATPQFMDILGKAFSLIVIIFFGIAILIAILILSFLLWIRKTVIFLLVAVAPVAFILYAFPPTQSLFKTWWDWFLKWTFMGPIIMFLVWVASQIGANNCVNFNVSALFAVCGVTYLAAIVPFKMGGAVMGAWAKVGKFAANKADYGLAKTTGWSPKSAYQAYNANATAKRDEVYAKATGDQRDAQNRLVGKKTHQGELAQQAIDNKIIREMTTEANDESGENQARIFSELHQNGQFSAAKQLLINASKTNQITDIMRELPDDTYDKMGLNHADKDLSLDGQYDFMEKALGNNADAMFLNRVGEGYTQAGIANGKRVFVDTNGNRKTMTAQEIKDAHTKRFGSKEARKGMNEYRIDGYLDKNDRLTDEFFEELSGLDEGHYAAIERNIGRTKTFDKLSQADNWAKIDAKARGGSVQAQKLQASLLKAGYGPRYNESHAQEIVAQVDPANPTLGESKIDIGTLARSQITADIENQLQARLASMPVENLGTLHGKITANTNFSPHLRAAADMVYTLRQTAIDVQDLKDKSRTDAQVIIDDVADKINDHLVPAMAQGVNPQKVVASALNSAGFEERENLLNAIKSRMETNSTPVIEIGAARRSTQQILNVFNHVSATPPGGTRRTEDQIKLAFSQELDAIGASGAQKHEAWKIIQAYNGVEPKRITKRGRGNDEDIDEDLLDSL